MVPLIRRRSFVTPLSPDDVANPLLRRVLSQRNITSPGELDLSLDKLIPPSCLKGIDGAVDLLCDQLESGGRVLIVSDFDADGATSCAVALRALKALGYTNLDYIVPNRFEYGYGLTPEIVELAKHKQPDLLITVDNGISSIEGVKLARQLGIRVLITDHHLPARELPAADAIVNPNQPGCEFASKALAGVGVIFYVMLALRARLRQQGWFERNTLQDPNMAQWLDLVALGTVADVVPLDYNNRILVYHGLQRIRAGKACAGLEAILQVGNRTAERLLATDLGFVVGPRLNAAGRLDDMSLGIECLTTDSVSVAGRIATQLDNLNSDRRLIESDMREQAFAELEALGFDENTLPAGLCVYDGKWHQGVIGILASRIKDKYHRPVIVFADAGEQSGTEGELKGSARSIPGFHIRDALDAIATQHPGLLQKFGGHAMAAGLSLGKKSLPIFQQAFADYAAAELESDQLCAVIASDGEVPGECFNLETAEILTRAGPWGQAFPEPVFDGIFQVLDLRVVAEKHLKLRVRPDQSNAVVEAMAFNAVPQAPENGAMIRLAFRLDVNAYRGNTRLQLIVEHLESVTAEPETVSTVL